MVEAIKESCNVFFYYVGDLLGVDGMTRYTARLGLGAETGLELYNRTGSVATENGNPGDTVRSAIGQSDHGYTPLQLSVYMSTVVNGGTRYSAHLLDSIRKYYTGELVEEYQIGVLDTVEFSDATYETLMTGMAQVVENPEVWQYFRDIPVTVGGKTGTAEVTGKEDYALFCGFAPLDSPEIVVSCVLEEGKHGYVASEVVARIMETYFEKQATGE